MSAVTCLYRWVVVPTLATEVAQIEAGDTTAVADTTTELAEAGEAVPTGTAVSEAKMLGESSTLLTCRSVRPVVTSRLDAELKAKAHIPELKN